MGDIVNQKIKLKINNSYESEPSIGSGSSTSGEHNEGQASDEENINLIYLLKPQKTYSNNKNSNKQTNQPIQTSETSTNQISPFHGFGDCPYGNINKSLYSSQYDKLKLPNKIVFPKIYETVIEENSCNAVDLPPLKQSTNAQAEKYIKNECNINQITASELSFNGKIKCITEELKPQMADVNEMPSTSHNYRSVHSSNVLEKIHTNNYSNERSPDLFADSDIEDNISDAVNHTIKEPKIEARGIDLIYSDSIVNEQTLDCPATQADTNNSALTLFRENCKRERELLRRIRRSLSGVRPPPSVTIPQLDLITTVINLKNEILDFFTKNSSNEIKFTSLLKPTHTVAEAQSMGWREVLGVRQQGLRYNLNKAAELNEYLSLSVIERYVGAETTTSYLSSPSSIEKRISRQKNKSPGNRLSHLAKRRAVFSSENLVTRALKMNQTLGPQIVINKTKSRNKRRATPKRMTPASKKKSRKTPTSSARKTLYRCDLNKPGPTRESSKRALFQSPAKSQPEHQQSKQVPPKLLIKPEIANRVEKSKRALFSPINSCKSTHSLQSSCSSTSQIEMLLKRKRVDADDDDVSQNNKIFRSDCDELTPRALKIKSESFCIGSSSLLANTRSTAAMCTNSSFSSNTSQVFGSSSNLQLNGKLQRARSDMSRTPEYLTDNQKKKLLWAVSLALQEKKISTTDPNFKLYAINLTRVVKPIFQEFYQKNVTSNSETMLRLAKKYVYCVISGKNSNDIYLQAKAQLEDKKRQSATRLSGYISPKAYEQLKHTKQSLGPSSTLASSVKNIFAGENSIESSFDLNQFSGMSSTFNSATSSQDTFFIQNSNDSTSKSASKQLPIQQNSKLQNSSSKSNLGGLALRENVDCELRRSAQKNFTGKDQRNISPYTVASTGNTNSGRKIQSQRCGESCSSSVKAKRQISFDS